MRRLVKIGRAGDVARASRLAVGCVLLGLMLLLAFSALAQAAAPQTPETGQASGVTATSATLTGVLNPKSAGEPGHYYFVYNPSLSSCTGEENRASSYESSNGQHGEAVQATLTGLLAGTVYSYCLLAEDELGEIAEGPVRTFTTPVAAPAIGESAVLSAGASSARVKVEVTPGGLPTTYHAEYVTQAQFDAHGWAEAQHVPATDRELPASSLPVALSEELVGLAPSTVYRFRFVAHNSAGATLGEEASFMTVAAIEAGSALPDGRSDELVSNSGGLGEPYPPTSEESGFRVNTGRVFQAAADGNAMTYVGEPGVSGGTGESQSGQGNQWLARRTTEGWKTEVIAPGGPRESAFQAFSADLSSGIIGGELSPSLVGETPTRCRGLYRRTAGDGLYEALSTVGETSGGCGSPLFAGTSADESQVIFQSEAALTADAEPATEVPPGHENHGAIGVQTAPCMFGCNLYDEQAGTLRLVNVIEGHVVPSANFGGYAGEGQSALTDLSGAISTDGSRIFWTDTQAGPKMGHVYVLEDDTGNVQVSGAGAAEFWTATPDGRYAFYTEAGQLWRFDTHTNTRSALTQSTAGVQGVIGINETGEDGLYLYFVANGALTGHGNATGQAAIEGQPNLYLLHEGVTTFIATLAEADNGVAIGGNFRGGDWLAALGGRTAEVTPDGRHVAFESVQPLTDYLGQTAREVFVYAVDDAQLTCASCSPTGSPPTIQEGAYTKVPVSAQSNTALRRWISADGNRVFFDSHQQLSSGDANATQDVYEWEREGEGTCSTQAVPRLNDGCVFLLSGGDSKSPSILVDADSTGDNVFFEHLGKLGNLAAPADHNELYDARVDGGFAHTSLACTGTGCQSVPPAPPIFATPASITFSGVGNLPAPSPSRPVAKRLTRAQKLASALAKCRSQSRRKRAACQQRARRQYGAKTKSKAKKSHAKGSK
jgi:hypothetical protein